ncbi:hypothetical protein BC793_102109 [Actinoplanes xinjiangensis]|jgi:hypothetical protein|uniref:Uncharacterized protein n=1 Tax=Actinoplanes xinjiangensis TaxID=512350 RepID=A0A316FSB2_9ACTN|nr:hypothetical protein BC793_102109 [Actinoplanes xinjiangensis]
MIDGTERNVPEPAGNAAGEGQESMTGRLW